MARPVKLTVAQAAAVAKCKPATWRSYVARGHAPAPDGREELFGHPWWWRSTVEVWVGGRPGRGSPGKSRKPGG